MAKFTYNTEDWELHAFLDWKPKQHTEECPDCYGKGTVGGGFKDIDGSRQCSTCCGTGRVTRAPTTPKPEMPAELVEHLRRAWWVFHNKR